MSQPQLDAVHDYLGPISFYRAPIVGVDEVPAGSVAVLGVPIDSWVLSRNGQRFGPRAVREASLYLAGYYGLQPEHVGYVNTLTGEVWTVPEEPRIFDVGDVRVHQADVAAQIEAIIDPVARITERGAMPVLLGGDHFVPYPGYLGFVRGLQARKPDAKVGFVNIDGHFDLWDEFKDLGRLNHGTFARRLAEHDAIGNMVWWGLNGINILQPDQLDLCLERGFVGYTVRGIRERGVEATMREALERASEGADAVYVTFDVDATDGAFAPGTNSMIFGGLTSGEVLEALAVVGQYDEVGAFDVSEMLPRFDVGGGRTARLGAHAVLEVVGRKVLDSAPRYDQAQLDAVLR
jgi:agmatinase